MKKNALSCKQQQTDKPGFTRQEIIFPQYEEALRKAAVQYYPQGPRLLLFLYFANS